MNTMNTMNSKTLTALPITLMLAIALPACSESGSGDHGHAHGEDTHTHEKTASPTGSGHTHADGSTHDDHADDTSDQTHQEIPLDALVINGMSIQLTQNHGPVGAGDEEHLIVKVDNGDTDIIGVRAWIGSEDRTLSYVGKGEYSVINDAYDIHTSAPDALDQNTMWWIEIEMPDGTKHTGSIKPVM